jgi:hypothetical protein
MFRMKNVNDFPLAQHHLRNPPQQQQQNQHQLTQQHSTDTTNVSTLQNNNRNNNTHSSSPAAFNQHHRIAANVANTQLILASEEERPISQSQRAGNNSYYNTVNYTDSFMKKFGIANSDSVNDFSNDVNNNSNTFGSLDEESAADLQLSPVSASQLQPIKSPSLQKLSERLRMMAKQQTSLEPIRTNTATNPSATSISKFYSTMNANTNIIYQLSKLRKPVRSESTKSNQNHKSQSRLHQAAFQSASLNSIDIDDMKMETLVDFNENYSFI